MRSKHRYVPEVCIAVWLLLRIAAFLGALLPQVDTSLRSPSAALLFGAWLVGVAALVYGLSVRTREKGYTGFLGLLGLLELIGLVVVLVLPVRSAQVANEASRPAV
jgi:hypothetical protein